MTDSMARDTKLTIYVEQDTKDTLQQEADDREMTLSTYIFDLIQSARRMRQQGELERETHAEERLEELISIGKDELTGLAARTTDIQDQQREMTAVSGAYSAALFHLLKSEYSQHERKEALRVGSERMRKELDDQLTDLSEDDVNDSDDSADDSDDDDSGDLLDDIS